MRHFLNGSLRCDCANCNRKANDHDDDVDQLQEERKKKNLSQEEEKEKKVNDIAKAQQLEENLEEIRKSLRKMSNKELDEELEKLTAELHELKKELHPEDDDVKKSRSGSLERIGTEPYHDNITIGDNLLTGERPKKSKYEVLALEPYTVGNSKNDSLLIKLGSVD